MSEDFGFNPCNEPGYYFVSYNSEDTERVGAIARRLHSNNVPLWYDKGIPYGEKWEAIIAEKIQKSQAVILFFTKGILFKEDSYVKKEYRIATKNFKKKVYVVMLDYIDDQSVPLDKVFWFNDIRDNHNIDIVDINDPDIISNKIMSAIDIKNSRKKQSQAIENKEESNNPFLAPVRESANTPMNNGDIFGGEPVSVGSFLSNSSDNIFLERIIDDKKDEKNYIKTDKPKYTPPALPRFMPPPAGVVKSKEKNDSNNVSSDSNSDGFDDDQFYIMINDIIKGKDLAEDEYSKKDTPNIQTKKEDLDDMFIEATSYEEELMVEREMKKMREAVKKESELEIKKLFNSKEPEKGEGKDTESDNKNAEKPLSIPIDLMINQIIKGEEPKHENNFENEDSLKSVNDAFDKIDHDEHNRINDLLLKKAFEDFDEALNYTYSPEEKIEEINLEEIEADFDDEIPLFSVYDEALDNVDENNLKSQKTSNKKTEENELQKLAKEVRTLNKTVAISSVGSADEVILWLKVFDSDLPFLKSPVLRNKKKDESLKKYIADCARLAAENEHADLGVCISDICLDRDRSKRYFIVCVSDSKTLKLKKFYSFKRATQADLFVAAGFETYKMIIDFNPSDNSQKTHFSKLISKIKK